VLVKALQRIRQGKSVYLPGDEFEIPGEDGLLLIKAGVVKKVERIVKVERIREEAPLTANEITDLKGGKAMEVIRQITDVNFLKEIYDQESRVTIKQAIRSRIKELS